MSASGANGMVLEASASASYKPRASTRRSGRFVDDTATGSVNSRCRPVSQAQPCSNELDAPESKRKALLDERQALLEHVLDKHDVLVRELFHMQQFTMMILYNPVEAKGDDSEVFQEFKAGFDLFAHATPTSPLTRQTRRSTNERRQILGSMSALTASRSSLSPAKSQAKTKSLNAEEVRNVIASSKSYKKQGKSRLEDDYNPKKTPASRSLHSGDEIVVRHRRLVRKETASDGKVPIQPLFKEEPPGDSISKEIRKRKRLRGDSPAPALLSPSPDKGQNIIIDSNGMKENLYLAAQDESVSTELARRGRIKELPLQTSVIKSKLRPTVISAIPPPSSFEPAPLLSPSRPQVKRIKLIVRRPPPLYSNPKQRPPRPKFSTSLNAFLTSYISVDADLENVDKVLLEHKAVEEAKLRESVAKLRWEGRFVSQEEADNSEMEVDENTDYTPPQRTSKDTWDVVVQDVITRFQAKPRRSAAKVVTSSIASRVQAHFDTLEGKKLKAREAEERRLRNRAKMTMKMVIGEWRKAVFHIREKQRLEEEEEERRLGDAHLDAILNQSGQILETQQGDLSKSNSHLRSHSGSLQDLDDNDSTDLDGDHAGTDAGDSRNLDGDISSDPDGPIEKRSDDEDTCMLLGEIFGTETTRSGTPSTNVEDGEDGADALLTADLLDVPVASNEVDGASSITDLDDLVYPMPNSSPMRPSPGVTTLEAASMGADVTAVSGASLWGSHYTMPLPNDTLHEQSIQPLDSEQLHNKQDCDITGDDKVVNFAEMQRLGQDDRDKDFSIVQVDVTHPNQADLQQDKVAEPTQESMMDSDGQVPEHLKSYAVAAVNRGRDEKLTPPLLLRGVLRPYQQSGLEWLASLHTNKLNGILADEMGLGKTIQTIALLAHLACDLGIWGPHLIVVPTSVLLNWEMEFKKFLPGFRTLSYHGNTKRRKELRQGWNDKHHFNVCITSYALASRDAHIFKRKAWYYIILDEAHMIKNFKSQRWNILLMFRSYRRLLLTGTPLQNNLTELWALLQFLMSGANFANLKEFGEWFANPLEKAIEMGNIHDDDTIQRVSKLHTVLRPYLLRRLKRDVEKELPRKYEHLTLCPLSKRQRFLYDEFMSRAQTRDALQSGIYLRIANILMQLRKVCNHPDLFEVRPIVTSFAMSRSAIADFEIKDMLIRRRLLNEEKESVDLDVVGLRFIHRQNVSLLAAVATRKLDATALLPHYAESFGDAPIKDTRTIDGFRNFAAYSRRAEAIARWTHKGYLNRLRCNRIPIYSEECLGVIKRLSIPIIPFSHLDTHFNYMDNVDRVNMIVKSYSTRAEESVNIINAFAFATPLVVARELPHLLFAGFSDIIQQLPLDFDEPLHKAAVKLQIAFPEASLLQYDCGKLQKLASLLREKKAGGHRVLIFTQMTRILDILELFLNVHGYLYLRLDGATKIEDRQYITERFNADPRIFCFISSSRSGGVGINLTGADTVIFYDSDFNPQMDRQCEDRAHRIGQIRDVHIYRFVSQYTVEEAMLRKANQKRSLDDLVIQKGEFDWRTLFNEESTSALTNALDEYEDVEDRLAAVAAAREETSLVGADEDDFDEVEITGSGSGDRSIENVGQDDNDVEDEQGATVLDYMLVFIERDWEHFADWKA